MLGLSQNTFLGSGFWKIWELRYKLLRLKHISVAKHRLTQGKPLAVTVTFKEAGKVAI